MAHFAAQVQPPPEAQMTRYMQAAAFATIGDLPSANLAAFDSVSPHLVRVHYHLATEAARMPLPGVSVEMARASHHEPLYFVHFQMSS